MEYCGMFEFRSWKNNTLPKFIHIWMRITGMEPFGLKYEWYTFGLYRTCLPLPEKPK